ncbi:MAG TPA: DUF1236 domain-containing protein [Xanthobacteraceae bacterium]|nr:DUF1236 domain-containing protein [Xanthobacteraceae bacterium]
MAISVALVIRNLPDGDPTPAPQAAKAPMPADTPVVAAKPEPAPQRVATQPAEEDRIPQAAAKPEPQPEPQTPPAPPLSTMQGRATELLAIPPAGIIGPKPSTPPAVAAIDPGGRLSFSPAQEDRVRYVLMSHNVMQTEAPDFPLQLGGTVPENVRLAPIPIEISDIVPNYRAYAYVISQNRIIIVATERRTISALISIEGRG